MGQVEDLRPSRKQRVMDLLKEAGFDVSNWANFSRGRRWAAANPKYCYEWAFIEPGRMVALNLWYNKLQKKNGKIIWSRKNRGKWIRHASAIERKRAETFDRAILKAYRDSLPIRAIINDGKMRDAGDPRAKASRVERRLLDPLLWAITSYDSKTGECTLTRDAIPRGSVDQFDVAQNEGEPVERIDVTTTVFPRDPTLRDAALDRANGKCELCLCPGFLTEKGLYFLETHHVIPLSENGPDSADNIVALCPNHHREAHYGARASVIRETLLDHLRQTERPSRLLQYSL